MSTASIELSGEQTAAVTAAESFIRGALANRSRLDPEQMLFRIGGYAGTGKTTILRALLDRSSHRAAVCAFTGKAASVLRRKGVDGARTIHATAYRAIPGTSPLKFQLRERDEFIAQKIFFFVIDEASMVNAPMLHDLQSFGLPIIAVGDPGQLEPVGSGDLNLMGRCDVTLERIHRQAADSPIIELARRIRMDEPWADTRCPEAIVVRGQDRPVAWDKVDIVLCAFNRTRQRLNGAARKHFGYRGLVAVGERIVCVRNDAGLGVFNGLCGVVVAVDPDSIIPYSAKCMVRWDGEEEAREHCLVFAIEGGPHAMRGEEVLVDYAYALTVHKAQGSEWPRVAIIDEQWPQKWDAKRWRYTAVTRASQSVVLVLP